MTDLPTLYLTQGSGNSIKPMLVASQLGYDCSLKYLDVLAGETQSPDYLAINPLGAVPFLTLADGTPLGESNAIAWYLAEGSHLIPNSSLGRAQVIRWMNFEQTSLEANISPVRFFTFIVPSMQDDHADMIPVWRERGTQALGVLDDYLKARDFIADDGYSVGDIAVFGYTHLASEGGFDLAAHANICNWIERVENQPGYRPIYELLDGQDRTMTAKAA